MSAGNQHTGNATVHTGQSEWFSTEDGARDLLSQSSVHHQLLTVQAERRWCKRCLEPFICWRCWFPAVAAIIAATVTAVVIFVWYDSKQHSHPPHSDPVDPVIGYTCESDLQNLSANSMMQKGLVLDDFTMIKCPDRIPALWPNTKASLKTIRLMGFSNLNWTDWERERAWNQIVQFVHDHNVMVLVGTNISCSESDDDGDWEIAKKLLVRLGPTRILGVAIGNELDQLQLKRDTTPDCIHQLWDGGYVVRKMESRIRDLGELQGFSEVPVTTVLGRLALSGYPFYEERGARISTMLRHVVGLIGNRWVFTFDFEPYLDPSNHLDSESSTNCTKAIKMATCFDDVQCRIINDTIAARQHVENLTGTQDSKLWIGMTGWSWPMSSTLGSEMKKCAAFSSEQTFRSYYQGFLSWKLDESRDVASVRPPEHAFFFGVRDSIARASDSEELTGHFGLIASCDSETCKMQATPSPSPPPPSPLPPPHPVIPASCKNEHWRNCNFLDGNCCPTNDGHWLYCCNASHPGMKADLLSHA